MPRPSPLLLLPFLLLAIHRVAGVSSRRAHASFAGPTAAASRRRQRGGRVRHHRIHPASRAAAATTSSRSGAEEASAADTASATTEGAESLSPSFSSSSGSSCPFSMAFPRYRIDLTGGRRDDGDDGVGVVKNVPFLSSVRASMDRYKAEGLYRSDVRDGAFRWIDVSGRSGDCPGAHAAAAFWEAVADVADGRDGGGGGRLVLAVPGTSVLTLRRLADVSNWLEERTGEGGAAGVVGSGRSVRASVDDASPVPTVVVSASGNAGGAPAPASAEEPSPRSESETAKVVEARTKSWVRRILVDLGVCPFTKSDTRSGQGLSDLGVPVARIAYHYSSAGLGQLPRLMADTWKAISEMISSGPAGKDGISSILLSAPAFDDDFPLWAGPVFAALESTVTAAAAEPNVGVVCFHPRYATPDGSSWPGFGHMHSVPRLRKWLEERDPHGAGELSDEEVAAGGAWQRRTPHACVNVLRAEQLAAAEGRRSTGDLYTANIKALVGHEGGVGSTKLSADLEEERRMER